MAIERYVTRIEAAQFLGVSLRKFDYLREEWRLRSYRFGKIVRFKISEIAAVADKQRAS